MRRWQKEEFGANANITTSICATKIIFYYNISINTKCVSAGSTVNVERNSLTHLRSIRSNKVGGC